MEKLQKVVQLSLLGERTLDPTHLRTDAVQTHGIDEAIGKITTLNPISLASATVQFGVLPLVAKLSRQGFGASVDTTFSASDLDVIPSQNATSAPATNASRSRSMASSIP